MSATFEQAARLFLAARDLPASQRDAFLRAECHGNPELESDVRALLRGAHHELPLEELRIEMESAAKRFESAIRVEDEIAPDVAAGSHTIGHYKLLEKIGEGGFGTVYMAEQLEPVRRKVALKILKPGMDTRQVIARFEAERQALARMDHPNITRVLDAGSTERGRPYFVMDLVRGVPITEFCAREHFTTRQRIDLFLPVCAAMQHAHMKGIIHRDLKPSNVLVTMHDGVPVPKVIDFGIAKAIHGKLTEKTLFTQFRQFIGTPAYMSPEQAEMSGLDVDTRTDVYSLGVLLYELLTGSTPFDKRQLASSSQAEVQRIIRETEPPTPSKRVSASFHADVASDESPIHDPDAANRLARQLRGDLDWIVMKCLEKDRGRRYSSVGDLARDIRNHLEDRTVLAGPPSPVYRVRRFARRNRGVLASLGVIFTALLSGLWLSIAGMREAQRERDAAMNARAVAMAEAARAQACVDLVVDMFQSADPTGSRPRQDSVKVLLNDFTAMHADRLDAQPDVALTIHRVAGSAYSALGELDEARYHSDAALQLARRLHGDHHLETAAALDLAALIDIRRGLVADAKQKISDALLVKRAEQGADSDGIAESLQHLSKAQRLSTEFDAAAASATDALAMLKRLHGERHALVATAHYSLAMVYAEQGRLDDAEREAQLAREIYEATLRPDHPYVAMAISEIANIASLEGDLPRARTLHEQALAMRITVLGEHHYEVAINRANVALVVRELGEFDLAESLLRQALETVANTFGESTPQFAALVGSLGATLWRAGKLDEAEKELRRAIAMQTALSGHGSLATANQLGNLAILLASRGELDEAEDLAREVTAIRRERYGPNHQATAIALNNLAAVLEDQGKLEEALRVFDESLAGIAKGVGVAHPLYAETQISQADLLNRLGKKDAAEANLREGLAHLKALPAPPLRHLADGLESLAIRIAESSELDEAIALLGECLEVRAKDRASAAWRIHRTRSIRGGLLVRKGRFEDALMDLSAAERELAKLPDAPHSEHQRTIERLVALYETWGRPADAETWRTALERP